MFCRKCGNKLSDNDAFCSKCGAKVIRSSSSPTDNAPAAARTESATRNWLNHLVVKFFLYLIIFVVVTILLYAMILPPKLSVVDFIDDPRGLSALVGSCLGGGLGAFLFFWPLLSGLSNLGVIPKYWKVEAFFLLAFVYEIGTILFGMNNFSKDIMTPILVGILILGILVKLFASSKKKK